MISKTGDINTLYGLKIYISNQDEIIGDIILNSFETSLIVHSTNFKILSTIKSPILNKTNSIFLRNLKVSDKYRNNGYGKKLLLYSISESKKFNVDYIFLICKKENNIAKLMYQKMGFIDYKCNMTDILMYKSLIKQ